MAEETTTIEQQHTFSRSDVLLLLGRLDTATSLRVIMMGGKKNPPVEYSQQENKAWRMGHLEGMNELGVTVRELLRAFYGKQGLNEDKETRDAEEADPV